MVFDLSQYCRLCAEISVIKLDASLLIHNKLLESISKYLYIKIDVGDRLPVRVCESCIMTVVTFEEFALRCRSAQTELENLLDQKDPTVLNLKTESNSPKLEIDFSSEEDFPIQGSPLAPDLTRLRHGKVLQKPHLKTNKTKLKNALEDKDPDYEIKKKRLNKKNKPQYSEEYTDGEYTIPPRKLFSWKENSVKERKNSSKESEKVTKRSPRQDYSHILRCVCHICSKLFRSVRSLESHLEKSHLASFQLVCICKTVLTSAKIAYGHIQRHCAKNSWKKHLPLEVRCKYTCEVCGSKFLTGSLLRQHINFVHKKIIASVCDVCGRPFANHGQLASHMLTHSQEKPFACSLCPTRFKLKSHLKKHEDCHSSTTYKCPKCPKMLNTKGTYYQHLKVHEDFLKYVCTFCNKAYKRNKALKCHMNRHTGYRPYSCLWCPKTFVDNSNLRDHKKNMHLKELREYEAEHGPPKGSCKKDTASETRVIVGPVPKNRHPKTIHLPKIDIDPIPLEYFPDFSNPGGT